MDGHRFGLGVLQRESYRGLVGACISLGLGDVHGSLGFPSLALLLLCRDNGGLESARVRARVRSAVARADCGMGSRALKARASAGSLANRRASKSKPRAAPKTCAGVLSAAGADVEEGGAHRAFGTLRQESEVL